MIQVFLPEALRTGLVFTYGRPSPVSAWTAAAVHDSWSHSVSDVAWYANVVGSTYALLAKRGRSRDLGSPCWMRRSCAASGEIGRLRGTPDSVGGVVELRNELCDASHGIHAGRVKLLQG